MWLWAIWLFGSAFAGLMWGIVIASANVSAKWWEAVSAVGGVVAALGTAGTLGFLVWENYLLRRQQKVQGLMQQYADADGLARYLSRLRRIAACVEDPGLSSQLPQLEELCTQIDSAKSRVSGQPGAAMYLNGLECAITLRDAADKQPGGSWEAYIRHVAHIDEVAEQLWKDVTDWRSRVIVDVKHLDGNIPGINL